MSTAVPLGVREALAVLDLHFEAFQAAKWHADKTGHPVPCDTRAWSQIIVSLLTGIPGLKRKKGADLENGSDVKAASTWSAIDTPRFNGAIPAGRVSKKAKKPENISALDGTPYIFFVLWDEQGADKKPRCRVWCVRAKADRVYRKMCAAWYANKVKGKIKSTNFQLHPPRNIDTDVFRNKCGNLIYPLLFSAVYDGKNFQSVSYDPSVLKAGLCTKA